MGRWLWCATVERETGRVELPAEARRPFGYDIYQLENEWRSFWVETGRPELKSPDAAFVGFCKTQTCAGPCASRRRLWLSNHQRSGRPPAERAILDVYWQPTIGGHHPAETLAPLPMLKFTGLASILIRGAAQGIGANRLPVGIRWSSVLHNLPNPPPCRCSRPGPEPPVRGGHRGVDSVKFLPNSFRISMRMASMSRPLDRECRVFFHLLLPPACSAFAACPNAAERVCSLENRADGDLSNFGFDQPIAGGSTRRGSE